MDFLLRVCVYKNLLYYLIRPFTNTLKHCTVPFKPFKQFNYEWVSFSLSFNSNSLGIKQRPFLKEIKLSSLLQASVNAPCTLTHSLSLVSLLFLILFLFLFFYGFSLYFAFLPHIKQFLCYFSIPLIRKSFKRRNKRKQRTAKIKYIFSMNKLPLLFASNMNELFTPESNVKFHPLYLALCLLPSELHTERNTQFPCFTFLSKTHFGNLIMTATANNNRNKKK